MFNDNLLALNHSNSLLNSSLVDLINCWRFEFLLNMFVSSAKSVNDSLQDAALMSFI